MLQEIVKIAENNVEVREYIVDKATDDKHYIKTTSYGNEGLTSELARATTDVTNWSDKIWVEVYRVKTLAEAQAKKDLLLDVQTAMAGAVQP